MDRDPL